METAASMSKAVPIASPVCEKVQSKVSRYKLSICKVKYPPKLVLTALNSPFNPDFFFSLSIPPLKTRSTSLICLSCALAHFHCKTLGHHKTPPTR